MNAPKKVIDTHANHEEVIERIALLLGNSHRRLSVFNAIYGRNRNAFSFETLCAKLSSEIPKQTVRNQLAFLSNHDIISKEPEQGKIVYGKINHIAANKTKILKLARNPSELNKIPTKRRPASAVSVSIEFPRDLVRVRHLTVDEISAFSKVKGIPVSEMLGNAISEETFKKGIQRIFGETGEFKDWGGEKSDLFTTKVQIEQDRVRAAFAFKGPGLRGKLTIAKMGKNGDQGQRLFEEPADIFFVQHCREIDSSVHKLMESFATAKSALERREIFFCLIDGSDSRRIVDAYPDYFA